MNLIALNLFQIFALLLAAAALIRAYLNNKNYYKEEGPPASRHP